MDDEYRCRAESHCAALTNDGPAQTVRPSTVCRICILRLQEQLDQLPEIRQILEMFKKRSLVPQNGEAIVSTSKGEAPVPINLDAVDVIDEIERLLDAIEGVAVADIVRWPLNEFTICGRTIRRDGVHAALEIGEVWRRADRVIGISRPWQRRHARCPECDLRTMGTFAGSNYIQCSSCGTTLTLDEYDEMCRVTAKRKGN